MKRLKTTKDRLTIGFLINQLAERTQSELWRGVRDAAQELDVNLLIFAGKSLHTPTEYTSEDESVQNVVYRLALPERLDGLLVSGGSIGSYIEDEEWHTFLSSFHPLPIVSIARRTQGIPSIQVDNRVAMKEAVAHLIEKHALRRIAFVQGPATNVEAVDRFQGYLDALREAGLPVQDQWIYPGDFRWPSGERAVELWFKDRSNAIEAVVAANDDTALGVLHRLEKLGLRCPEDVLVVGFDDVEESRYAQTPLSTVRQPFIEQGKQAVKLLIDLIEGKTVPESTTIKTLFVPRSSCGCSIDPKLEIDVNPKAMESNVRKRLLLQRALWQLNRSETYRTENTTLETILDHLTKTLLSVGIEQCRITMFPQEETHWPAYSQLVYVLDESGVRKWTNQEVLFPTRHVLPDQVIPYERRTTQLVLPLFDRKKAFGFVFFEIGHEEELVYSILREQISFRLSHWDVTSEKQTAEHQLHKTMLELQKSEERFKEMAVLLPTIIFEVDLSQQIQFVNKAGLIALAAATENQILERSLADFLWKDDQANFQEECRKAILGHIGRFLPFRLQKLDGKTTTWLGRAAVYRDAGVVKGIRWGAIDLKGLVESMLSPEAKVAQSFGLTDRETEILACLIKGDKHREIAESLFISENTVKTHVSSIYQKIGVRSKDALFDKMRSSQIGSFGYDSYLFSILSQLFKES